MPDYTQIGKPGCTKWVGRVLAVIAATDNTVMEIVKLRAYSATLLDTAATDLRLA
jgi:hypothetical protein